MSARRPLEGGRVAPAGEHGWVRFANPRLREHGAKRRAHGGNPRVPPGTCREIVQLVAVAALLLSGCDAAVDRLIEVVAGRDGMRFTLAAKE